MSPTTSSTADDRGSIPIALLGIIALTAVVGALVATTVGGTRAARFDQQYTEVIQVADAGAQVGAQELIRAVPPADLESTAVTGPTDPPPYSGTGTIDGVTYTWEARKRDALRWEVTGSATTPAVAGVAPVTREVTMEVVDRSRFFVAAFSDKSFILRGGNAASSYNIDEGVYITSTTGNGIVASNGTIRLNGNTYVDGVQLFNFDVLPQLSRCDGKDVEGQCDDLLAGPIAPSATIGPRLEIGSGEEIDTQFIDDQRAACGTLTSFAGSGTVYLGTTGTHTVLCYDNFSLDKQSELIIRGTVEIYVYGNLSFGNATEVNCAGCDAGLAPDSTKLKIYSDGGEVSIGNQSYVAAGIYAPESVCAGNPSNAQGEIYGSMICEEIANQGGWAFHFDDQLAEQGAGEWRMRSWREE